MKRTSEPPHWQVRKQGGGRRAQVAVVRGSRADFTPVGKRESDGVMAMSAALRSGFPVEPSEKRSALLRAVASIRGTVVAHADEAEARGTLPPPIVDALVSTGLLTLKLPAALGGAEADPATQFMVIEALSAIDPSTGWCLMIGGTGVGLPGAFLADEAIAQMFAGGRAPTGAIVPTPTGEARPVDGGYRLTGRWSFASGVPHAEWVTVGGRVLRGDGEPLPRLFVVPAKSVIIHDNWHVAGLKGTGSADVSLDEVFVPDAFSWDRLAMPPQRGGALYRLGHPGFVANEHAAFAIGVARGALEAVMELARSKRRSFAASPSSIEQRPVFQRAIGLADVRLRAARALVLEVYDEAWAFATMGEVPPPRVQAAIRSAAAFATEVAAEVTMDAFRFGGGEAAYSAHRLQRYLRDINVGAQHLMVSTIAYENHGQFMMGLPGADPLR
jgi:alkylation response protein AidB-like acyl-CoA dehydrogenase